MACANTHGWVRFCVCVCVARYDVCMRQFFPIFQRCFRFVPAEITGFDDRIWVLFKIFFSACLNIFFIFLLSRSKIFVQKKPLFQYLPTQRNRMNDITANNWSLLRSFPHKNKKTGKTVSDSTLWFQSNDTVRQFPANNLWRCDAHSEEFNTR